MKTAAYAIGWMVLAAALCGAAAKPADPAELLAKARGGDEASRIKAIGGLGQRGKTIPGSVDLLAELLQDPSAKIKARAADALGDLGPDAKAAFPELKKLLSDAQPTVRREAVRALLRIVTDEETVRALVERSLEEKDPVVRLALMRQVADLGKRSVPALIEGLKDEAEEYQACLLLADIGSGAAAAVPALTEEVKTSKDPAERREAIVALGAIGSASAPAVPALIDAMGEPTLTVVAAFSLGQIGGGAKDAEAALAKVEASKDRFEQVVGAWASARVKPANKKRVEKSVSVLLAAAAEKDPAIRAVALRGLATLRVNPEQVLPALGKMMKDADAKTMGHLLTALRPIGEPAVPQLINALELVEHRRAVANVLVALGPKAKAAVPALLEVAKNDKNPNVREEALLAVAAIGPTSEAVALAEKMLGDEDEDVVYSACYLLGAAGKSAESAEAVLEAKLKSADPVLRFLAAWALVNIDASDARGLKLVPILARGLTESLPRYRQEAAEALGSLGATAKDAVPALKKATTDRDEQVRKAVEEALRQIGG